jgi:hypothetical protein
MTGPEPGEPEASHETGSGRVSEPWAACEDQS